MQNLLQLQSLDSGESQEKNAGDIIAGLRGAIPPPILAHYDRLHARGKKGLAVVRNQVCAECHMGIPLGTIMTIRHGADLQLCGNCGRCLYLPDLAETESPAPVEAANPRANRANGRLSPMPFESASPIAANVNWRTRLNWWTRFPATVSAVLQRRPQRLGSWNACRCETVATGLG